MSRSTIGVLTDKGVTFIYCHNSGGYDAMGSMLINHYTDEAKIKELISLGFISRLEKDLNPKGEHSFHNPEEGVTVAYNRDRGNKEVGAIKVKVRKGAGIREILEDYSKEYIGSELYYLYLPEEKEWVVYFFDPTGARIVNVRTGQPVDENKGQLTITREESNSYARRIRLNKGKNFTIRTNRGRVYLVEEFYSGDERFYQELDKVSWDLFKKGAKGSRVTQKMIADYLYNKYNK